MLMMDLYLLEFIILFLFIKEESHGTTISTRAHLSFTLAHTPIRLVNGSTIYSGRVEIQHNGQWGTICDNSFDDDDAKVICRMLRMNNGHSLSVGYSEAYFGEGQGPVWLSELRCRGYETDLNQCTRTGFYDQRYRGCAHHEDIGVDCNGDVKKQSTLLQLFGLTTTAGYTQDTTTSESRSTTVTATSRVHIPFTLTHTPVRLVNGSSVYDGRVEIQHDGRWGTICDHSFDNDDAKVICRMLGMYNADRNSVGYSGAYFGEGQGPIWLSELRCRGYETDLNQCTRTGFYDQRFRGCAHHEDIGVDCNATANFYSTLLWRSDVTTESLTQAATVRKYTLSDAISVNCHVNGWDIKIDMNVLRQIHPGSKESDIYLGENRCDGIEKGGTLSFHQGLQECLTSKTVQDNEAVYSNELVYAEHDPVHTFIIRYYNWTAGVECNVYTNGTFAGYLHDDHSADNLSKSEKITNDTINVTFFSDASFNFQLKGDPLHVAVGTDVYVKVFTTSDDWTINMRVNSCYTKPTPSSPDHMKLYLIQNGCEADGTTHIISQSSHETRFVFQNFEYTSNKDGIFVYCDAIFCDFADTTSECVQPCHPTSV